MLYKSAHAKPTVSLRSSFTSSFMGDILQPAENTGTTCKVVATAMVNSKAAFLVVATIISATGARAFLPSVCRPLLVSSLNNLHLFSRGK